jgi:hypothetical protein
MMMPYLCHWFTCSQLYHSMCISMCPTKKIKTPTLVEIVSINPYSSVDDHFPFFL